MALPSDYISGTITLTNGSTAFTGAGTGWLAADFREGDIILDVEGGEGAVAVIQSITSNTAGVLSKEWEGATVTDAAYRMRYQWDSGRVSAQSRAAIEMLGNGNLQSFSAVTGPGVVVMDGPHSVTVKPETDFVNGVAYDVQVDTLADRDAYDGQSEGFAVLVADVGDGRSALYSKNSNTVGDWSDPAYITGPLGPLPDVEATVDMLPPGSTATVTPTPITGGVRLDFELPEASGFYNAGVYDIAEEYDQDDVVHYNGSSFIALQAVPAGESPSSAFPPADTAYWQTFARRGVDGAGTVTSIVAGPGITVDNADPANPIISGGVTDGSKGDITVSSSGTIWNLNAASVGSSEIDASQAAAIRAVLDVAPSLEVVPTLTAGTAAASDNANAINAAITAVNSLGGGTVRIGGGTWYCTNILMKPKVKLKGLGRDTSALINNLADSSPLIRADNQSISNLWMEVSDLKLLKPNMTGGCILDMTSWQFCRVASTWLFGNSILGTELIRMRGLYTTSPLTFTTEGTYNLVEWNYGGSCAFGIRVGPNANTCWILHNRLQPSVTGGFGIVVGTTGGDAAPITGFPNQVVIDQNSVEHTGAGGVSGMRGVYIESAARDVIVTNNRFEGAGLSDAIGAQAGATGYAAGNHFSDNTGSRVLGISSKFQSLDMSEGDARLVPVAKMSIVGTTGAKIGNAHNLTATRTGVGAYTFTFATPMDNTNYTIPSPGLVGSGDVVAFIRTKSTTGFTVEAKVPGGALTDVLQVHVVVWP
jgi:hypothetical protein